MITEVVAGARSRFPFCSAGKPTHAGVVGSAAGRVDPPRPVNAARGHGGNRIIQLAIEIVIAANTVSAGRAILPATNGRVTDGSFRRGRRILSYKRGHNQFRPFIMKPGKPE